MYCVSDQGLDECMINVHYYHFHHTHTKSFHQSRPLSQPSTGIQLNPSLTPAELGGEPGV